MPSNSIVQESNFYKEVIRCPWSGKHADYQAYHDYEWGRPTSNDSSLFEKICLEGFQSGLSWLTILRKREDFRFCFDDFEPRLVADFDSHKIEELLGNERIIRNRAKIASAINNASHALEIIHEYGSLSRYFWKFAPKQTGNFATSIIPTFTEESQNLSKDLKKRGWKFVGPTTLYSFMQAVGIVNDHLINCWVYEEVEEEQRKNRLNNLY